MEALDGAVLPAGVRARMLDGINGLRVHVLEAGEPGRPCLLLLHGFPELAYSWRKVMPALAAAGFHVVAPDQRGYGRTTGWNADYDGDIAAFRQLNLVRDALGLVRALGVKAVAAVIGHDAGASVAAYCGLIRPDVFRRVVLMSAPFGGPPQPGQGTGGEIQSTLASLLRPRKHYRWYYSTRPADDDMWRCKQGVHDFLRAYYHHKSADWPGNRPYPLAGWTAGELAKLPTYYVMEQEQTMAQTVAAEMPSADAIAACVWLPDAELRVYSGEYGRTGFQGGLQWYRCGTEGWPNAELDMFAGRAITVPACFISGASDWGIYQTPGTIERMQAAACADFRGVHLLEGAGHWVQQEQPELVTRLLLTFLGG
jgi:pimeloyl-ACP methyl ester carboxylesterase